MSRRTVRWDPELPAAAGAAAMATGIVSVGLQLAGHRTLSLIALAVDMALWLLLATAFTNELLRHRDRWTAQAATPPALTAVAATTVLGTRLSLLGWQEVAAALLAMAALVWPLGSTLWTGGRAHRAAGRRAGAPRPLPRLVRRADVCGDPTAAPHVRHHALVQGLPARHDRGGVPVPVHVGRRRVAGASGTCPAVDRGGRLAPDVRRADPDAHPGAANITGARGAPGAYEYTRLVVRFRRSCGLFCLEGHLVAELVELAHQSSGPAGSAGAFEEVAAAEVGVLDVVGERAPDLDEDGVFQDDQGAFLAPAAADASVPGSEAGVLGARGADGGLAERRLQLWIAVTGLAGGLPARGLVVAGADADPGRDPIPSGNRP